MRLPQSSKAHLSLFSITISLIFIVILLSPAHAATQQLACSPASLTFGGVIVGQSETQLVTLTNNGTTSVTISSVSASGSVYTVSGLQLPVVVSGGQSVDLNVTFKPNADGWFGGNILISSNASNSSLRLYVQGGGAKSQSVSASPSSLSFGSVSVGQTVTLPIVFTNTRKWQVGLTSLQSSGSGYSVTGPSMPLKLGGGQSVTLNVTFNPQWMGQVGGSVYVGGVSVSIPLNGTGTTSAVGNLTGSPSALTFGNVDVGNPSTQPFTITASGGAVTISSATSSNSQFTISGISLPLTLNPSQSAQVYVTFSPAKSGATAGTVTLISNASNNQDLESVSGTGVQPTYSVSLSWSASTSDVVGYNVYRGTSAGSYSKINTAPDSATTFTDSTVAAGVTYYYAATSVSSSGQESGYSTPVQVSVP